MKARSFREQRELLDLKLKELQGQKFYGRVTLVINAGNIVQAEINRSWKLKEEADGIARKKAQAHGLPDQEASAGAEHPDQEA